MKNIILATTMMAALAGCATQPRNAWEGPAINIISSDATRAHPDYAGHYSECKRYAMSSQSSVGDSALGGAAAGAGLASLFGLILGVKSGYGRLAGVGALSGGLSAAGGTWVNNQVDYKGIMLNCLRQRGHEVY